MVYPNDRTFDHLQTLQREAAIVFTLWDCVCVCVCHRVKSMTFEIRSRNGIHFEYFARCFYVCPSDRLRQRDSVTTVHEAIPVQLTFQVWCWVKNFKVWSDQILGNGPLLSHLRLWPYLALRLDCLHCKSRMCYFTLLILRKQEPQTLSKPPLRLPSSFPICFEIHPQLPSLLPLLSPSSKHLFCKCPSSGGNGRRLWV